MALGAIFCIIGAVRALRRKKMGLSFGNLDRLFLYPEEHHDEVNDITSYHATEPVATKGPFKIYNAYLPATREKILLLMSGDGWSYHARYDEDCGDVFRTAIAALKKQRAYKQDYRIKQLPAIIWFLVSERPDATRLDAVAAGNCTAGTDKWFRDHGYAERQSVRWYHQLKHLFGDKSRMVAWHLWRQARG